MSQTPSFSSAYINHNLDLTTLLINATGAVGTDGRIAAARALFKDIDFITPKDDIPSMAGTCRIFNEPGGVWEAVDAASYCHNIIPAGRNIFMMQNNPIEQDFTLTMGLAPLQGVFNQGCALAFMTYYCNLFYSPCVTIPPAEAGGATQYAPTLPCDDYVDNILYPSCPVPAALGLFAEVKSAPAPNCNTALVAAASQWTPSTTSPEGRVATIPQYVCPLPLADVQFDPNYPHATLLGGPCSTPCPSFLFTQEDRVWRDKFSLGWFIPSTIMGLLLLFSYWCIPMLRKRIYICLGVTGIMFQGIFIGFPFFNTLRKYGMGGGQNDLCAGPQYNGVWAAELTGDNFLCGIQGWSGPFAMFTSLLCVNFLAWSLLEKIVFANQISLTEAQNKWRHRIQIAASLVVPGVFAIVEHAYGQLNGNNALGTSCGTGMARDVTTGPNLSDGIGMIGAAICVFAALIQLITVFCYLTWMIANKRVAASASITWAQFRIITLVVVMCSLYLVMFTFRLCMELWIEKDMGASIGEWIVCMLTSAGGAAQCGEKPAYTIPSDWSNYILWISSTGGFTFFIACAYTNDIWYGWAALIYFYFGHKASGKLDVLLPYAKRGGYDEMVDLDRKARTKRTGNTAIRNNGHESRTQKDGGQSRTRSSHHSDLGNLELSQAPGSPTAGPTSPTSEVMASKRQQMFKKSANHGMASPTGAAAGRASFAGSSGSVELSETGGSGLHGSQSGNFSAGPSGMPPMTLPPHVEQEDDGEDEEDAAWATRTRTTTNGTTPSSAGLHHVVVANEDDDDNNNNNNITANAASERKASELTLDVHREEWIDWNHLYSPWSNTTCLITLFSSSKQPPYATPYQHIHMNTAFAPWWIHSCLMTSRLDTFFQCTCNSSPYFSTHLDMIQRLSPAISFPSLAKPPSFPNNSDFLFFTPTITTTPQHTHHVPYFRY